MPDEDEETNEEADFKRRAKGEPAPDHENGQEYKDLEPAARTMKFWRSRTPTKPETPSEDRARRLGAVVRFLRQNGWVVTVRADGLLLIWDAKYPPPTN
jgi:hypothetical protein